jgi:hypothetical protein
LVDRGYGKPISSHVVAAASGENERDRFVMRLPLLESSAASWERRAQAEQAQHYPEPLDLECTPAEPAARRRQPAVRPWLRMLPPPR